MEAVVRVMEVQQVRDRFLHMHDPSKLDNIPILNIKDGSVVHQQALYDGTSAINGLIYLLCHHLWQTEHIQSNTIELPHPVTEVMEHDMLCIEAILMATVVLFDLLAISTAQVLNHMKDPEQIRLLCNICNIRFSPALII